MNRNRHKPIFRLISLALIHAFLALDMAGPGQFSVPADTTTLAPQLILQAESFTRTFEVWTTEEDSGRTTHIDPAKPVLQKSHKVSVFAGLLLAGMLFVQMLVPLSAVLPGGYAASFAQSVARNHAPSSGIKTGQADSVVVASPQRTFSAELKRLQRAAQNGILMEEMIPGGKVDTIIADSFSRRGRLLFTTARANKRIADINTAIREIRSHYGDTGELPAYITKRGDSEAALSIADALLILLVSAPGTYAFLETNEIPIYLSPLPGGTVAYSSASRWFGTWGLPYAKINEKNIDNPFIVADIIMHETVHMRAKPQSWWGAVLKYNPYYVTKNMLFTVFAELRPEEKEAFKKQDELRAVFDIAVSKEIISDRKIERGTAYFDHKWRELSYDWLGFMIFQIYPLGMVLAAAAMIKKLILPSRRGGRTSYRRSSDLLKNQKPGRRNTKLRAGILIPLAGALSGQEIVFGLLSPAAAAATTGIQADVTGLGIPAVAVGIAGMCVAAAVAWRFLRRTTRSENGLLYKLAGWWHRMVPRSQGEQRMDSPGPLTGTDRNDAGGPVREDGGDLSSSVVSQERLDAEQAEKFERIVRWARDGDHLMDVWGQLQSGKSPRVDIAFLKNLVSRLVSHNPLYKITGKGEPGDRILTFETPGRVIKEFNDVLGYEGNTNLMVTRIKEIYDMMNREGIAKGEDKHLYSSYKDDGYLIPAGAKESNVVTDTARRLTVELEKTMTNALVQDKNFRTSLESKGYRIIEYSLPTERGAETIVEISHPQEGAFSYRVNFGMAEIEHALVQKYGQKHARLLADIMAHKAIVLGKDIFSEQDYERFIKEEIGDRRRDLQQRAADKGIVVFGRMRRGEREFDVLRFEINKILRSGAAWDSLAPGQRELFGSDEALYHSVQSYYAALRIQDFIKKWQMDFGAAYAWAERGNEIMARVQKTVQAAAAKTEMPGEAGDPEHEVMLSRIQAALSYLFQDPKTPERTSAYVFHGRASRMTHPVYISIDVKDMNALNHVEFEIETQMIEAALAEANTDAVFDIWTSAADTVTEAKNTAFGEVVKIINEFGREQQWHQGTGVDMVTDTTGGDEIMVVFDQVTDIESLGRLLARIQSGVEKESGLRIRIAATAAIDALRRESISRPMREKDRIKGEVEGRYLAHAKALILLEDGIHGSKEHEKAGMQDSIFVQDGGGDWQAYHNKMFVMESTLRRLGWDQEQIAVLEKIMQGGSPLIQHIVSEVYRQDPGDILAAAKKLLAEFNEAPANRDRSVTTDLGEFLRISSKGYYDPYQMMAGWLTGSEMMSVVLAGESGDEYDRRFLGGIFRNFCVMVRAADIMKDIFSSLPRVEVHRQAHAELQLESAI